LSHKWSHPAFEQEQEGASYDTPSAKITSEQWLRDYTARADIGPYEALMKAAREYVAGDSFDNDYLLIRDYNAYGGIPDKVWDHLEVVLGQKITTRASSYTCSC
jgi:hypothetical protein